MEYKRSMRLRLGRFSEIGRIYLLTSVTVDRTPLFSDWRAARLVSNEFRREQEAGTSFSIAWVIMPDHFHWLVELKKGRLSSLVQRVKSRSSITVNRHVDRAGQLWQRGYHDRALRREEDLKETARYVLANPIQSVRALWNV